MGGEGDRSVEFRSVGWIIERCDESASTAHIRALSHGRIVCQGKVLRLRRCRSRCGLQRCGGAGWRRRALQRGAVLHLLDDADALAQVDGHSSGGRSLSREYDNIVGANETLTLLAAIEWARTIDRNCRAADER